MQGDPAHVDRRRLGPCEHEPAVTGPAVCRKLRGLHYSGRKERSLSDQPGCYAGSFRAQTCRSEARGRGRGARRPCAGRARPSGRAPSTCAAWVPRTSLAHCLPASCTKAARLLSHQAPAEACAHKLRSLGTRHGSCPLGACLLREAERMWKLRSRVAVHASCLRPACCVRD